MVTKHRADLPVLCGCFPVAINFTFGSVYMSIPLSHFITSYPSPSPYPQDHSLVGLCLYSRLATRFFMTFFFFSLRFHIYVLANKYRLSFYYWVVRILMYSGDQSLIRYMICGLQTLSYNSSFTSLLHFTPIRVLHSHQTGLFFPPLFSFSFLKMRHIQKKRE